MPHANKTPVLLLVQKSDNLFLNLRTFSDTVTQIIKLSAAYLTAANGFHLFNMWRMNRKSFLYAYTVRNAANGKCLADSAALFCDNGAFKNLNSFAVSLFNLVMNLDGVSDIDFRYFLF